MIGCRLVKDYIKKFLSIENISSGYAIQMKAASA
jgi:hypothetical protein